MNRPLLSFQRNGCSKTSEYPKPIVICIIAVGVFTLPVTFYHLSGLIIPTPPVPVNEYGEFPFRIVYEIGNERFTIEDTLICEYDGRDKESFTGREIKWIGRLASGDRMNRGSRFKPEFEYVKNHSYSVVIIQDAPTGDGYLASLQVDIGIAEYYMRYYVFEDYRPGTVYIGTRENLQDDVLWEEFNVRIIELSFSETLSEGNDIDLANVKW